MKKTAIAAVMLASVAMATTVAVNARPQNRVRKAPDCEIIVEVDRPLSTLTQEGILNSQKAVQNRIAQYVTTDFTVLDSFHVLNNAFSIRIHSDYIDLVKNIPGVKSVTKNEIHWVSNVYNDDSYISLDKTGSATEYGGSTNVSAVTMQKPGADESLPGSTNDGEGTVIAILDNEFYFRAEHTETNQSGEEVTVDTWMHETYTDLDANTVKRLDFITEGEQSEIDASKARYLNWVEGTHAATKDSEYDAIPDKATRVKNTPLGKEGSLYLNSKVPFYFDYGGEKKVHSDYASHDFDVSSQISYHGSHVSSIAGGNAPTYKGIAPKAQLICMKVFCEYKPTEVEAAVGLSAGSYGYDLPILRALEDAILLGVDGINMSLGNNLNDFETDSITCKTLSRLASGDTETGTPAILTAISAGNDGKSSYDFAGGYGNWTFDMVETGTHSGYANLDEVTTIAAGQPIRKFYTNAFKMGDAYVEYDDQVVNREGMADDYDVEHKMKDLIDPEHPEKELEWVYVPGFGTDADFAALSAREIDVSDKIAVIKRGNISFAQKYLNAHSRGAAAVVIINNDPTASSFNMRMDFGGEQPAIPVCMVLYSDMPKFGVECDEGDFTIINDQIGDNIRKLTASTFSSDGGTYDLRLKPDVTAPGENIRGAVPPQKKEDSEAHPLATYEFLSGTSMSAPNYAGAQSVMFSKFAKDYYGTNPEGLTPEELYEYRSTIDMRLMSTAVPMKDYESDPELYYSTLKAYEEAKAAGVPEEDLPEIIEKQQYTSPRIQGAGMVNLGAAYNTDVYLEGLDAQGKGTGKAKIELGNNLQINQGNVELSFATHKESEGSRQYSVELSILRPAVEHTADVLTKEFNFLGDVTEIENFPGRIYYDSEYNEEGFQPAVEHMSTTSFSKMDTYNVPRDIKYWATAEACAADHPEQGVVTYDHQTVLKAGKYYNVGNDVTAVWELCPDSPYQSTQDTLVAQVTLPDITIESGDHVINLPVQSLTPEQKATILENYEYGCYLEGYVRLTSKDTTKEDLSICWMGFFGGEGNDYGSAPVVEPFSFEKDPARIYPSDLVNDLGKSLLGLSNVDMGSEWITTYVEPGRSFNTDELIQNKESLSHLCEIDPAYHLVGTDLEGNRYPSPEDNIYVGSPNTSNTMIIQQFVLRSVKDNYFEIKNEYGEVVYRDALQDMLYGSDHHAWPLYKSHVDGGFLGGGYIAHRAWAVINLYDVNGNPFPSGKYTLTFNYELAGYSETISKSYNMIIDSETPTIESVVENEDKITINIAEQEFASLYLGSSDYTSELVYDETTGKYSLTITKEEAIKILNESINRENGTGRLFVGMYDKAYGYTGAIIKFNKKDKNAKDHYSADIIRNYRYIPLFNNYTIVERPDFELNYDIEDLGSVINYYTLDAKGNPSQVFINGYVKVTRFPEKKSSGGGSSSSGCGGSIATTSITLSALAGALAISLFIAKTRKKKGGQE